MSYKIFIRPEAETDLNKACFWYENQKVGLGKELVLQIDSCIASMQKNPLLFPLKYKVVRRALVHRFPYSVFYVIEKQTIAVIAIFHAKRDPRVWQDRI